LAVLAGLGGAVLLYAVHRPAALIAMGAVGIFAAALKFFDWLIELKLEGGRLPARSASRRSGMNARRYDAVLFDLLTAFLTRFVARYLRDRNLQREIREGLNVVESWINM
jgi:hypothetical protein